MQVFGLYTSPTISKKIKGGRYLHSGPGNFSAAPGIVDKQDGAKDKRVFAQGVLFGRVG